MRYTEINIRYTPKWNAYNEAQKREKSLFMELLVDLCVGVEEERYNIGKPRNNLADMLLCSAFNVRWDYLITSVIYINTPPIVSQSA